MSAVCPSSEVDELTISLLTIFDHRGLSFELLETLIKQEIEETGKRHIFFVRAASTNHFIQRMSPKYCGARVSQQRCSQYMLDGREHRI